MGSESIEGHAYPPAGRRDTLVNFKLTMKVEPTPARGRRGLRVTAGSAAAAGGSRAFKLLLALPVPLTGTGRALPVAA